MTDAYVRPDILVRKVTRGSEVLVNYSYLARLTGEMPEGKQAHHILPQKFIDFFLEADINIHDPKYGAWLDTKLHQKYSNKYNVEWDKFFKHHANPSQDEIYDFADKLMKEIYE